MKQRTTLTKYVLAGLGLIAALAPVGRVSAANYTWTNTADGASGYWTNGLLWGSATAYPGSNTTDSAYLTNATPAGTSYTNILNTSLANLITTLALSNSTGGQSWLIVTNASLTNTTLSINNGGRLQIDNGGVVTNAGLTWRGTNGTIYLNSGGKLVASANITAISGASGVTSTVTRTGTSLPAGIWDFNGKTLATSSGNNNVLRVDGGGVTGGVVLTNIAASILVSGLGNELILTNGAKLTTVNNQEINTKGILTIVGGGAPGVTTVAEFGSGLLQIGNFTSDALIRVDGNGVASGAVLAASNLYIGAAGAQTNNGLSIVNGGRVDASIILSYSNGGSNYLNVGSAGAASYLVGNVTLGRAGGGYNTMTTTNAVIRGGLVIGDGTLVNNSNTVTVLKDTAWNFNNGGLTFAALGNSTGNVMVINGGVVSNVSLVYFGSTGASVGSSLTVSNGGKLFVAGAVRVGNPANSSGNAYNVGGFGLSSTVTNGTLIVGNTGAGFNTMTVTNATLQSGAGTIGSGSSNNTATVNAGGTWNLRGNNLTVGSGAATGNVLTINMGGVVSNVGTLMATGTNNRVVLNAGTLSVNNLIYSNTLDFTVGTGSSTAMLALVSGTSRFEGNLIVSTNATLKGAGTILTGTGKSVIISNGATIAPGNSPGILTADNVTWYGGSFFHLEATNLASTAGVGWDLLSVTGALTINPNGNPFMVNLDSMGNSAAAVNFNAANDYNLQFVNFSSQTGFDPAQFTVNTNAFNVGGAPASGSWGVTLVGSSLYLTYSVLSITPDFVWSNGVTGGWSGGANWTNNTGAPTPSATRILKFAGTGTTGYTSTNDLGTFQLNQLVLASSSTGTNTIMGNTIQFAGTTPLLYQQGGGQFIISNSINLAAKTEFRGPGPGSVTLASNITGTAGFTMAGSYNLIVQGSNTFTGPVLVDNTSGRLTLTNAYALGTNSLTVSNGTLFSAIAYTVGRGWSNQQALVTGSASLWTNATTLVVGSGAAVNNSVTIETNATLRVTDLKVGTNGAVFNSLVITNGGRMFSTAASVIGFAASSNTVLVTGSGAFWTNTSTLTIGTGAATGNVVTVANQGALRATSVTVGTNGAVFNSLVITNGGQVISSLASVIGFGTSNNLATVSDSGSWNLGNQILTVGTGQATGNVLRVGTGGLVTNLSTLVIGIGAARSNVVQLSGGAVWATSVVATSAGNRVTFDAGTVSAGTLTYSNGTALVVGDGSSAATLILGSGNHSFQQGINLLTNSYLKGNNATLGATITNTLIGGNIAIGADAGQTFTNNGPIVGTATTLTKQDAGTVVLTGNSTYTGNTVVNAGTLTIANATGTGISASPVTVSGGNFVVNNTGGTGLGAGLTVSSGSAFITNTAGTGVAANVAVNGGNLWINNTGGFAVSAGQTVTIGGGTVAGNGTLAGSVVLNSGTLTAGNNSLDTLTMGGLTMNGGYLVVEFLTTGLNNDKWSVTDSGGLTINGGTVMLYTNNSTTRFDASGTYQLIAYSGSVGGAGVGALSVGNPAGNRTYNFGTSGGYVILGIGGSGIGWNPGSPLGDTWWTNAANWGGGGGPAPVANDQLLFDGNTKTDNTNNFASGTKFAGIVFTNTAGAFILNPMAAGTNVVNLVGNVVNRSANTQTINLPLVMDGATWAFNALNGNMIANGVISGSDSTAGLTKQGANLLILTGANTYSGVTEIVSGTLRASDGGGLPTASNLKLNGGVLETSGTFSRSLGTSSGSLQWTGSGGFSAYGSTLSVNIGNAGAAQTWGNANFVQTGSALLFSSSTADSTVKFINPLDLGTGPRTVQVADGSQFVDVDMIGAITGATGGLTKTGGGGMRLSGNSSFTGAINVDGGALIANASISAGSSLNLASGTYLYGTGTIGRVISGSGTIAPGSSPGILTVNQLNPSANMNFNFEFTNISDPDYTLPGASLNDVLRITNSTPFAVALGITNTVNLYISGVTLVVGQTNVFRGGFYTDIGGAFDSWITNATYNVFGSGVGALQYVTTVPTNAFGVGGYVMEFGVLGGTILTVIPEPNVLVMWLAGAVTFWAARRRHSRGTRS